MVLVKKEVINEMALVDERLPQNWVWYSGVVVQSGVDTQRVIGGMIRVNCHQHREAKFLRDEEVPSAMHWQRG